MNPFDLFDMDDEEATSFFSKVRPKLKYLLWFGGAGIILLICIAALLHAFNWDVKYLGLDIWARTENMFKEIWPKFMSWFKESNKAEKVEEAGEAGDFDFDMFQFEENTVKKV